MPELGVYDLVELVAGHGRFVAGTSAMVLEPPRDGGVVVEVFDAGGYTIDVATIPVDKVRLVRAPASPALRLTRSRERGPTTHPTRACRVPASLPPSR